MSDAPRNRRILIVDDEEFVLRALRRGLRDEGYTLLTCSRPTEALELLREHPVDVVLSDQLMPELTGLELLTAVRERFPDCMRVLLTGHADMQTAIDAINHGAIFRFLTKPWDDTELKVVLHMAFEQQALERENRRLLASARQAAHALAPADPPVVLPRLRSIQRDPGGAIVVDDLDLPGPLSGAA